ncbi:MAG TPA: hypothetical protein VGH74_16695, partial [Planctomycetaceae bacterium]
MRSDPPRFNQQTASPAVPVDHHVAPRQPTKLTESDKSNDQVRNLLQAAACLRAAGYQDLANAAEKEARQIAGAAGYIERRQSELQKLRRDAVTVEHELAALAAGDAHGRTTILVRVRWMELDPAKLGRRRVEWNKFFQRQARIGDGKQGSPGNTSAANPSDPAAVHSLFPLVLLGGDGKSAQEFEDLIESLNRDGAIKVLAEPNLTTVDGRPAEFFDGGQAAVPVLNAGGAPAEIEFCRYGIGMRIVPRV